VLELGDEGVVGVKRGELEFFGEVDDAGGDVLLKGEPDGATDFEDGFLCQRGGEGEVEGGEEGGKEGGGGGGEGAGKVVETAGRHMGEFSEGAQVEEVGEGRGRGREGGRVVLVADEDVEGDLTGR